jgi:hypothetical protein
MINNSDILIQEVDEALRNEKMQRFILLFGRYIIVVSILILFATISYVWWQNNKLYQNQIIGEKLFSAIELVESGNSREAKPIFDELAKHDNKHFAMIANMWQVKLKYLSDKKSEAAEIAASSADKIDKDSTLKSYYDWFALIADFNKSNQIYKMNSLELIAASHAIKSEYELAAQALQQILVMPNIISTIKERAAYLEQTVEQ